MKYIRFMLSDKTKVKFKIRRLVPNGLDIAWKYTERLNFAKYINLKVLWYQIDKKIELLEQLSDTELIDMYKSLIEEEHMKIKNTKRKI